MLFFFMHQILLALFFGGGDGRNRGVRQIREGGEGRMWQGWRSFDGRAAGGVGVCSRPPLEVRSLGGLPVGCAQPVGSFVRWGGSRSGFLCRAGTQVRPTNEPCPNEPRPTNEPPPAARPTTNPTQRTAGSPPTAGGTLFVTGEGDDEKRVG